MKRGLTSQGIKASLLGLMLNLSIANAASDNQPLPSETTVRPVALRAMGFNKATEEQWENARAHGIFVKHLNEGHEHVASRMALAPLPSAVDLRKDFPAVFNQGQLGSCTANATVAAAMYEISSRWKLKESQRVPMLSRLFLYYDSRALEGTIDEDSGAFLPDVILSLHKQGVCDETLWPYSDDGIKFKQRPPRECYTQALKCRDLDPENSASVEQNLNAIKTILAHGCPIVVGITLFESFSSDTVATTGMVPMPDLSTEQCIGGHAVVIAGYDSEYFLMRNSWGTDWGIDGYFKLPIAYLLDSGLACDFLKIGRMSSSSGVTTYAHQAFAGAKFISSGETTETEDSDAEAA